MNKYKNLWEINDLENIQTSNIVEFLESQCDHFNKKYSNSISAKMVEMQYYQSVMSNLAQAFASNIMLTSGRYEYGDNEIKEKENINNLLKDLYYSFVIYNKKYKFNIFYISIYPYYPMKIELDSDISKELNLESKIIEVVDFKNLEEWLIKIFNSNKVKCVINKLKETNE